MLALLKALKVSSYICMISPPCSYVFLLTTYIPTYIRICSLYMKYFILGKIAHAAVGRIALVMALAAASGGITSTIVSSLVQVHSNVLWT